MPDKKFDNDVAQFCSVTGASAKDARKFMEAHKRLDIAIDAYYTNPNAFASSGRRKGDSSAPSSNPDDENITVDGTIKFCEDLEVDPEDVVLLAIATVDKSRVGGRLEVDWVAAPFSRITTVLVLNQLGLANRTDSISGMKNALTRLRDQLASDPNYFQKVYNHTFDFARSEGQRSLGLETAQAFWGLLLPHGFQGGALARVDDDEDDVKMDGDEGWKEEYIQWWFDFMNQKGQKGVSKDTWVMFLDFIKSTNSTFSNYDMEAAWPSTIDDFVEYAKHRLVSGA
ncbi:hypothetical protein CVT25_003082 [Psilocybe cyanescens]|uniref:Defective in cullin neddylation protein n=1 Tax=Psilocybe cyanescens TaxID=93625 RepID=A0A409X4Y2_PSICY|nr:hypothetical protein CVT25_003082 [Psilocybe cyanescens]